MAVGHHQIRRHDEPGAAIGNAGIVGKLDAPHRGNGLFDSCPGVLVAEMGPQPRHRTGKAVVLDVDNRTALGQDDGLEREHVVCVDLFAGEEPAAG